MSERFFIVTDKSPHRKEYLDYLENRNAVNKTVKNFFLEFGISSDQYYASTEYICIVGTKENKDKFGNQFLKNPWRSNGLYQFKKASSVGKAWIDRKIVVIEYPFVLWWFEGVKRLKHKLFELDDVVYLYISSDYEFSIPFGFKEIKGSEYYKIIEDYEAAKA